MKILPEQMRLYAVTDRTWLHGRKLIDVVSEAIDGGAAVSYTHLTLPTRRNV